MATQMLSHAIYDISVTDENSRDCRETFKMRSKIDPETMQKSGFRGCPGALWRHPGWSWGVWGRFLRFLARSVEIFREVGAKMGPR